MIDPCLPMRKKLNKLHDEKGMSWREIAELPEYEGIPAGSLCSFAKSWEPKTNKSRRQFGLDTFELIPQVRNGKSGQFLKRSE